MTTDDKAGVIAFLLSQAAEREKCARELVAVGDWEAAFSVGQAGIGIRKAVDALRIHLGVDSGTPAGLEAKAVDLARGGDKIAAIKHVRNATGWGLRESKDWVDWVEAHC